MRFSFTQLMSCTSAVAIFCGVAVGFSDTAAQILVGSIAVLAVYMLTIGIARLEPDVATPSWVCWLVEFGRGALSIGWACYLVGVLFVSSLGSKWHEVQGSVFAMLKGMRESLARCEWHLLSFVAFVGFAVVFFLIATSWRRQAKPLFFLSLASCVAVVAFEYTR